MNQNQPENAENIFWIFEAEYEAIRDWVFIKEGIPLKPDPTKGKSNPAEKNETFEAFFKRYYSN